MEVSPPYSFTDEVLPEPESSLGPETSPEPLLPASEAAVTTPELTVQESNFVKKAVEKRPEAVLTHVERAAEQDKPIEALYEKRHEIKDDETSTPMVPISQVVEALPDRQPALNPVPVQLGDLPTTLEDGRSGVIAPLSYKQAMRLGFIVAVGLITLLVLGYLLLHR